MYEIPLFITVLAFLFLRHYFAVRSRKNFTVRSRKNSPPSPPKLPVFGNLHQLGPLLHRSMWSLSERYGPLMLLHLGSKPMVVVSSADVAKEMLKTHDLAFADRPDMKDLRKVFYDLTDVINLPYGDRWRKLRGILVHHLLSTSRVKSFASIREEEVAIFTKKIKDCSTSSSTPVNLTEMFAALSADFISRAALGKKYSETEVGKKFLEFLEEGARLLFNFSIGEFVPWLAWIDRARGLDAALDKVVEGRDEISDAVIGAYLKTGMESSRSKDNIMGILLGICNGDVPGVSIDLLDIKGLVLVR